MRTAAQRHVDELSKQKKSIAAHLAQISQLLGASMPGLVDVPQSSPAQQPAVAAPAATAITAGRAATGDPAPAARRSEAHAEKASSGGKQADRDDEWWTE